ncbi:MAG: ABC transporter ATP-binding protein [Burkholderiales bacterium]|nr:ABC transporter ATP-binding protein [Anaerolineae bacterium]
MSIILNHVAKSYDSAPVVRDISLEIQSGELFVLLGASGSGKSTLLRLIAGLIPLDAGSIELDGRDVTLQPPQARNTGFVFQNYSLFRHMTVAQNIEFGLEIRKVGRREREQRVDELLHLIDLDGLGKRMPSQLSGGQQQRVALARALAYQPSVLLLDEPFGALDVKIRSQLRQNLREIQRSLNVTAILVTHDQDEAFELADRIGIIEGGKLLEVGTPDALYRRPQKRFTATFLGATNLLVGQRNGTHVYIGEKSLLAPPNTEHLSGQLVEVLVRPEEVELALHADDLRGQLLGRGIVQETGFAGPVERVTVRLTDNNGGTPIQVLLSPGESRALTIEPQREVWVGLKDFHLLAREGAVPNKAYSVQSAK